jgi:tetratricopeptide (TPR) repeat protein
MSQGKLAEAERVFAKGVDACQRAFTGPHALTPILLHHHADALRALGRADDALPEARRAVDMYSEHPEASNEGAHAVSILQSILREQGRPDEALAARRDWVSLQRRNLPHISVDLANQLRMFGEDLLKHGTLETAREAETMFRECLEIRIRAIPDSWLVDTARSLLGRAVLATVELDPALTSEARAARLREAEPLLLDGYAGLEDNPNVPTPAQAGGADRRREALERIVRLYEVWGRVEPDQGYDAKASEWRKALDAAHAPAAPEHK